MDFLQTPLGFWYGFVFLLVFCGGMQALIQCHFLMRFTAVKSRPVYYVLYLVILYLDSALGFFLPVPQSLSTLAGVLILFAFVRFILKQNNPTSVIISTLVITVNVLVESLYPPLHNLLLARLQFLGLGLNIFEGLLILLMTYGFLQFFAVRYNLKTNEKSRYLLLLALPLLFISIVMRSLITFQYPSVYTDYQPVNTASAAENLQFFVFAVAAFFCVCGSLFAYEKVLGYLEAERKNLILAAQLAMQKNYVEEARARFEATRMFRHDFRNHILTLSGLIEKKEYAKAAKYLESFDQMAQKTSFAVCTGNPTLDALFSEKLAYAEQLGIQVNLDLLIPPAVKIDDFDLCTIFANAVDNAIRACSSVPAENKQIEITAKPSKEFLIIELLNPYTPGQVQPGSGSGLPIIHWVAEKYHGAVEIVEDNEVFRLSMILPFNPSQ